jgi:hypothetical protein
MPPADVTPTTTTPTADPTAADAAVDAPAANAPAVDATTPASKANEEGQCLVCPHPWSGHDVTSARFCTATMAAALTRGCVCPRA